MLFSFFATATQEAVNDEDLYPLQKPSLLAKIKFDLFSVKPDSVFMIFLSISICAWSYKLRSLICLANKSLSGRELNSSSGVIFVVSKHFLINVFKFSFNKFDEVIDDFFLSK